MTCQNCDISFEGNFCPNCGQKPNSGRIVFKESARDVLEHYFDFDTPLLRTISGLLTRPGALVREYIFGKRKSYSHPIRYYILVLAVYIILQNILGFDPIATFNKILGNTQQPDMSSPSTRGSYFFRDNINLFILLFGFFLALFNKLLFRKSGFYFIEHLALSFYIIAQYILFAIFILPLTYLSPYFFLANYFIVLLYPIYVMYSFHSGKKIGRFFKALLVSFLSWICYVIVGQFSATVIVTSFGL